MLEESANLKAKLASKWENFKDASFKVFVELLKNARSGKVSAITIYIFAWLQIYGTILVEGTYISWDDSIAGPFVYEFFRMVRLIPVLITQQASYIYLILYVFCKIILRFFNSQHASIDNTNYLYLHRNMFGL